MVVVVVAIVVVVVVIIVLVLLLLSFDALLGLKQSFPCFFTIQ